MMLNRWKCSKEECSGLNAEFTMEYMYTKSRKLNYPQMMVLTYKVKNKYCNSKRLIYVNKEQFFSASFKNFVHTTLKV